MFPSSNGGKIVSPSCVKVYLNNFAKDEKIVINKRVARKTFLCIASENSLRSTTSYIMTITASNLIDVKIPQDNTQDPRRSEERRGSWVSRTQDPRRSEERRGSWV